MRNRFLLVPVLFGLGLTGPDVATAQVYVIESDSARFMDASNVIAGADRGLEVYALEEKDGWVKTVEPGSQRLAWVRKSETKRKVFTKAQLAEEADLWNRMTTIEAYVNAPTATAAQLQEALTCSRELRRFWNDKHPHAAIAVHYAGLIAIKVGALAQAQTLLTQALELHRNLYGKASPRTASLHLDLANLALNTGELKTGVEHARSAWQINRDALGVNHPDAIAALVPAAQAMELIDDYEDALEKYRIVHRIWLKHYGPDDLRTLQIDTKIAKQLARLGRKTEAIPIFESLIKRLVAQHPQQEALIAVNRARLASTRMDATDSASIQAYQEAVDVIHQRFPRELESLRTEQSLLVQSLLSQDDFSTAFRIVDDSLRRLGRSIRREFWGMTDEQQRDFLLSSDGYAFFKGVSLAMDFAKHQQIVAVSSEWLINGKGLVQEAQSVQAGVLLDLQKRDAWSSQPYVTLDDFRNALPEGAVYADLLRFMDFDYDAGQPAEDADFRYAAWIIHRQGNVQLLDLGPADPIDQAIRDLRVKLTNSLKDIKESGVEAAYESLLPKLQTVSRLIWQPIAKASGNPDDLIISPDHLTWLLPWAALLNEDGTFAVESCNVRLELSGRDIVRTNPTQARQPAVIFAAPAYDSEVSEPVLDQTRAIDISGLGFGDVLKLPPVASLASSAAEASFISPFIKQLTGQPPRMLLQEQALESAFRELHGPEILVVSTHGFTLSEHRSATAASDSESRSLSGDNGAVGNLLVNPLLQCGLMLAGANRHRSIDRLENDGVLTGLEISATDLKGTRLAVLSACETGLGDLENAGGVVGLRRAFHVAGAESVLASLWEVKDRDTAILIVGLFQALARNSHVGTALQEAQINHIHTHRNRFGVAHPFYWAAFTLTGESHF
ncbi:MAG: CHAT domain-containing protein [Planctomycetaceae bacterium]